MEYDDSHHRRTRWLHRVRIMEPEHVYEILTSKYDPTLPSILHRNINSNPLKLCTYRPKYDLCKYNFMARVIRVTASQHM